VLRVAYKRGRGTTGCDKGFLQLGPRRPHCGKHISQKAFSNGLTVKGFIEMIRVIKNFIAILSFVAVLIATSAGTTHAQGSRKDDIVFNAQGRPMAGATVRVCTSAASGQPCTPLAMIYSDVALTQALANPLSTDGMGNYSFYAAPGRYMIELSGPGIITKQMPNIILPTDPTLSAFTAVTTASLNGILYVGTSPGQYASLQAAHDALPSTGGTIWITPSYVDTETATVNITKNDVTVLCLNQPHFFDTNDTEIVFNHTSVGINVTGQQFGMDGCHLKIGTNSARTGVPMIDSNTTLGGRLSNLVVTGQSASTNNGIFFRSTDASVRQGLWQLDNIIQRDGYTWTSIITVSIASNSLTGAYYKFSDIVDSDSEKYTDAAIVLDGTIDTVQMDRIDPGNALATGGKTIWIRNTVSSSGNGYPRWVHCDNCYLEAGGNVGGVALQIDSGKDISFWGYIANAGNAVNVTNSLAGVNIHDTVLTNSFGTAIAVTGGTGINIHHNTFTGTQQAAISYAGGGGILIDGNTFWDSSAQTTNTYDTISIAASTGNVQVVNNSWLNQAPNKPRYGINFLGNESGIVVSGNNYGAQTFGTTFLNPPSNNVNLQIIGQDSTVTNKFAGNTTAPSFISLGAACTNGELALSAGWGSTAAASAVAGTGQTCQWTITASGTGQAANPTITDTLTNTLPSTLIVCEIRMVGGTGTATLINQTTLSATAPIFTFGGTPGAGSTYLVVRRCGP
jgi:hypothetical protein